MNLTKYGFDGLNINGQNLSNDFEIGRVLTVNKESYVITNGEKDFFAKLTGNLMFSAESPEDFPTTGDFVEFQKFDDDSLVLIHNIIERKSLLKRKTAGKKIDFQLIAANIDYALVVQAMDNDLNINRLERYLSMVKNAKIEPIILFSKADLLSESQQVEILNSLKNRLGETATLVFSNVKKNGFLKVKDILKAKETYCLIGSSGVGKTTLLNNLIGKEIYETKEVRRGDSKGKHATTRRQLILLENGAMIIDTPGMRELANISINNGIEQTFDEIVDLSKNCKYADCTHTVEKGCEVLEAVENNLLDQHQYENYIKLKKESDHYERSYLEKRKRDKEFGKMVREVMKYKKK